MPLILRASTLVQLTFDEVDGNFTYLEGLSTALDARLTKTEAFGNLVSVSNSIAVALDAEYDNFHHELLEDTVLGLPTGGTPGQKGIMEFTQNATLANTFGFDTFWKFPGGTPPTITATLGAVDVMRYQISRDGSFAICEWLAAIS